MNSFCCGILSALLLSSLSLPPPAFAQNLPERKLSLEEAVRIAMKQNPELTSARLEVRRADSRVREAWGNALPAVDISSQYVHFIDKPVTYFPDYLVYGLYKIIDSTYHAPKMTG